MSVSKKSGVGNPLRLMLEGVTPTSTPSEIAGRVEILRKLVHQAKSQPSRVFGQKLRKTSTIAFTFPIHPGCGLEETTKTKIISTDTDGIRIDADGASSKHRKPWQATAAKMIDIFRALRRYAAFAEKLLAIEKRLEDGEVLAVVEVPDDHPSAFYGRYVKRIFGPRYRDLHDALKKRKEALERKAVIDEVLPGVAPVGETVRIIKQVTETEQASQTEAPESEVLRPEDLAP